MSDEWYGLDAIAMNLVQSDIDRAEKERAEERKAEAALRALRGEKGLSDLMAQAAVAPKDDYDARLDVVIKEQDKKRDAALEKMQGRVPPPIISGDI